MSSEKAGKDQPSEDPRFDAPVDSLLHLGNIKDGSSEIEKFGDLRPGIRLSDTCRKTWCPGDGRDQLDGVGLAGRRWFWDDKGDGDNDDIECTEGDSFMDDGSETAGDSVGSFTSNGTLVVVECD